MQMPTTSIAKQVRWKIFQEKFLVHILASYPLFFYGLVVCISMALGFLTIQHG
jgi:hypothetical protein